MGAAMVSNRESEPSFSLPLQSAAEQGPFSLKWSHDGELSAVDLQGILARLSAVDQQASTLMNCQLED